MSSAVDNTFDLAIIGGGINGCGIARDAAGRGLSVYLCEQNDLASATSSASTKLIHGGLRYLEYYEFLLVRKALIEREILLRNAPHIIWPMRFILPHHRGLRPAWLIRLGLFLYDHLGGRKILPGTKTLYLRTDAVGEPLRDEFVRGFEYSDCCVADSRLVVLNARDASDRGATIDVRTKCVGAERGEKLWQLTMEDADTGAKKEIAAKALVNASGPWVSEFLGQTIGANSPAKIRLVKGSHIVVPRHFAHDRAYIFQNSDNRIIFAIPYEENFTLIGTTEFDYDGDLGAVEINDEEIAYLCAAASEYFKKPVTVASVVHCFSGVRPLYDDGADDAKSTTRDYILELTGGPGSGGSGSGGSGSGGSGNEIAPLLNIFGGKITTYRRLAQAALRALYPDAGAPWTQNASLPGGDFPVDGFDMLVEKLIEEFDFLTPAHATRLARAYGTLVRHILKGATSIADLGENFGADLYAKEVAYLIEEEWARTADDVLWRRSKLGQRFSAAQSTRLADWMARYLTKKSTQSGATEPTALAMGRS
ncbi:MAG: glycerol-3-phosphate dehydrogenase [Alphaproteobacteria bacterium]